MVKKYFYSSILDTGREPNNDSNNNTIALEDHAFSEMREFIYQYSGIYLTDSKRQVLESYLSDRLQVLQLSGGDQYLQYLKTQVNQNGEMQRLMDAISSSETRFFRNQPQLSAFQQVVIPEIVEKKRQEGNKRLRILSAGCSSGEEPYTLMMILDYHFPQIFQEFRVDLIGTDISTKVLQMAVRGVYSDFALYQVEEQYVKKYFRRERDNFRLNEDIKKRVKFYQINLMEQEKMKALGQFDVIFCRNVLIYFERSSKSKAIQTFYQILQPDGYLFLGRSESLFGVHHPFKLVHFVRSIGYKKSTKVN